jgi:hypothetical protein
MPIEYKAINILLLNYRLFLPVEITNIFALEIKEHYFYPDKIISKSIFEKYTLERENPFILFHSFV